MRTTTLVVVVATAAALTAGCGSDASSGPSATATQTVTATVTASPEASDTSSTSASDPNIGNDALTVGDTREGALINTTLLEVRDPYPPGQYREPDAGQRWVGLRLKTCVHDDAPKAGQGESYTSSTESEFAVLNGNGDSYAASGSSWTDWPQPHYATLQTMQPGECVQGWMAIGTPTEVHGVALTWSPGGDHLVDWKLK